MNLSIITRRPLVTLNVHDSCRRAAELMTEHHIRHLPVLDAGIPAGMVSERDLLAAIGWWDNHRKHADERIPDWSERLAVAEVMSSPLHCLPLDADLDKAIRLMLHKKISAVALAGAGRLEGIVTESDFLHCFKTDAWQRGTVVEHMTANVFQVRPDEPIRAAWRLMRQKQIRHLVVMDYDRLRGILSDRDLLAGISWDAAGPAGIQDQVRHIMTTQVATISPESPLAAAAERMLEWKIGALPVMDCENLTGIITETDLLKAWVKEPPA